MRLAEKYKFQKLVMVGVWDWDDLQTEHKSFWKTKINHEKIKRNVQKIVVVTSDNDPYVTAKCQPLLRERWKERIFGITELNLTNR